MAEGMRQNGLLITKLAGPVSSGTWDVRFRNPGRSAFRFSWRTEGIWYGVAALLRTAAILKAEGLFLASAIRGHPDATDWLMLAAIQWEILLASWLLSRYRGSAGSHSSRTKRRALGTGEMGRHAIANSG